MLLTDTGVYTLTNTNVAGQQLTDNKQFVNKTQVMPSSNQPFCIDRGKEGELLHRMKQSPP